MKIDLNERMITLFDLARLFLQWKRILAVVTAFSAACGFLFALSFPVEYKLTATFKEQGEIKAEGLKEFREALGTIFDSAQTALVMKSYRVLKPLVERLGLQCREKKKPEWFLPYLIAELQKPLPDREAFRFQQVSYEGEKPLALSIKFLDELHFEAIGKKERVQGNMGELIKLKDVSLRLVHTPKNLKLGHRYLFVVHPWIDLVHEFQSKILIKAHKQNRSIYQLSFLHPDRFLGAEILNELMVQYQRYLKEEHDQRAALDLAYLQKREQDLSHRLREVLEEQKAYLQKNINELGCMNLGQESAEFSIPHRELFLRACSLELEEKQLAAWRETDSPLLLEHTSIGPRVHSLSAAMEELHRERNLLDDALVAGEIPLVPPSDCEGIDLQTARALLVESHRILDEQAFTKTQLLHLIQRMEDPAFELSALGTILHDEVSRNLLSTALSFHMQLQDRDHYTPLERERASQALALHKNILKGHLAQLIEAGNRKEALYREKVAFLQSTCIRCIDQQIAAHLAGMVHLVHQRKESLKEEQRLLEQKMKELRRGMKDFPTHWHEEHLLKLEADMRTKLVQAIHQLTETKTMGHQFYHVASKPLDFAVPPLLAQKPGLLFFTVGGGVVGGTIAFVLLVAISLLRGFPVGIETMKALGFSYYGRLGRSDEEETLKKILVGIQGKKTTALLFGSGPEYSSQLSKMMAQWGIHASFLRPERGIIPSLEGINYPVIFVSYAPLDSAEALHLANHAQQVIATITNEPLERIHSLARHPDLRFLKAEGS